MSPDDIVPGAIVRWRVGRHAGYEMRLIEVRNRQVLAETRPGGKSRSTNQGSRQLHLRLTDLEARATLVRLPRLNERRAGR